MAGKRSVKKAKEINHNDHKSHNFPKVHSTECQKLTQIYVRRIQSIRIRWCGSALQTSIDENLDLHLITPYGLPTRVDPGAGKSSTIDLILATPRLAFLVEEVQTGPYMSSDLLTAIQNFSNIEPTISNRLSRWKFDDSRWQQWNEDVEKQLLSGYSCATNQNEACEIFTSSLIRSGKNFFKYDSPQVKARTKPWWTAECAKACAITLKLERIWRKNPNDIHKKMEYRKAEAKKKKLINETERKTVDGLLTSLGKDKDTARL